MFTIFRNGISHSTVSYIKKPRFIVDAQGNIFPVNGGLITVHEIQNDSRVATNHSLVAKSHLSSIR